MKRILILAALLAGCQPEQNPSSPNLAASGWLDIDTDQYTGCEYISKRNSGAGITPRMAADGKTQMGCKGARP